MQYYPFAHFRATKHAFFARAAHTTTPRHLRIPAGRVILIILYSIGLPGPGPQTGPLTSRHCLTRNPTTRTEQFGEHAASEEATRDSRKELVALTGIEPVFED